MNTADINKLDKCVAVMMEQMSNIMLDVKDIKQKLETNYATKEWVNAEYGQTRKQINALIITVLTAVVLAVIGLVIKK